MCEFFDFQILIYRGDGKVILLLRNSDIFLAESDIARQSLAVIFYSPPKLA
jgi:hypothetical protein